MGKVDKNTLKKWFKRGAKPNEDQFESLIDSMIHKDEGIALEQMPELIEALDEKAPAEHGHGNYLDKTNPNLEEGEAEVLKKALNIKDGAEVIDEIVPEEIDKAVNSKAVMNWSIQKINTMAELRNTVGKEEGQVVELLGYYEAGDKEPLKYKWTNTQGVDDGGAVINSVNGSWIAIFEGLIDVRVFGVKYNDLTINNSDLINKCINYASINNIREVLIPEGNIYLELYINKDSEYAWARLNNYAIELKSNIDLNIKANLKLKTKNIAEYSILRLKNTSNVNIYGGGIIEGDVIDNADASLEFGFGIQIFNSQDVTISDLEIKNCLGDGIMLNSYSSLNPVNTNIKVLNNKIHTNSRQGISVLDADGLDIYNNYIYNTGLIKGKLPMAGIDIEPEASNSVRNVNIINNSIYDNFGQQIALIALREASEIYNIVISNNNINNSSRRNQQKSINVIQLTSGTSNSKYIQNVSITDNDISMVSPVSDSESQVIHISKSDNVKIRNNNIIIKDESIKGIDGTRNNNIDISDNSIKNSLHGVALSSTNNLLIKGNYFDNFTYGITCVLSNDIKILNNTISGDISSSMTAIQILYGKYSIVDNNIINNIYGNTINIGDSHKHSIISNNIITNVGIANGANCIAIYSTDSEPTQFVVIKNNMFNYLDDIIYDNSLLIDSTYGSNNINVIGNIINKKDNHSLREYSFNSPTTSRYLPIIKQSLNVDDITAENATDLDSAITLLNELKSKLNAKLTADRNSGQQAT